MTPYQISEALGKRGGKEEDMEQPTAYLMHGSPPGGSRPNLSLTEHEKLAVIKINFEWQGLRIQDEFTWSLTNKDPLEMKAFALKTLEDLLASRINSYSEEDISEFCERIAYEISKQVAAAELFEKIGVYAGDGHGVRPERIIRVKLDYKDGFVQIKDEFDWDLSNTSNEPEEFAGLYVKEQGLPYVYKSIIAKLVRKQLLDAICKSFMETEQMLSKSSMCVQKPFYTMAEVHESLPGIIEDWKSQQELLFNGSLEKELGPMGQFKRITPESTKEYIPAFLKKKPKAKVFEIIEDLSKKPLPINEKGTGKTTSEENADEFEEVKEKIQYKSTGLSIIINKETFDVDVMLDNVEMEKSWGRNKRKEKLNGKKHTKRQVRRKSIDSMDGSQGVNVIKLDIRQLLNGTNGAK